MRTKFPTMDLRLRIGAAAVSALLLASAVASAQPFATPDGTWDFAVSGGQQGVAFLTFDAKDFSISGIEVVTRRVSAPSSNPRGESDTRGDSSGTNEMFFFGLAQVAGSWTFDSAGRVVGVFSEGDEGVHQSASFTASVRTGKRMVMHVLESPDPGSLSTAPRKSTYNGVPFTTVTNALEGTWLANGRLSPDNGVPTQSFTEIVSLSNFSSNPSLLSDPLFSTLPQLGAEPGVSNSFFFSGHGAGYTNVGVALVSSQKKIAIASLQISTLSTNVDEGGQGSLRGLAGSLNAKNGTANLVGVDDFMSRVSYRAKRVLLP